MNIKDCYNYEDFRKLAKKKLPAPIFHYIDGGADDEITLNRNTDAFKDCDLVPNILNSVGEPDLSTTVFGRKIDLPLFLSLLNSPSLIFEMMPFIYLLAAQLFFIKLFENKEIEILKYFGLKNSKIIFILSSISLISALLITILFYSLSSN